MSTTTLTPAAIRAELVKAIEADLIGPFVPAGTPEQVRRCSRSLRRAGT